MDSLDTMEPTWRNIGPPLSDDAEPGTPASEDLALLQRARVAYGIMERGLPPSAIRQPAPPAGTPAAGCNGDGSRSPWPLSPEPAIRQHTVTSKVTVAIPDPNHVFDTPCQVAIGLLPKSTVPFRPSPEEFHGSITLLGVVVRHN